MRTFLLPFLTLLIVAAVLGCGCTTNPALSGPGLPSPAGENATGGDASVPANLTPLLLPLMISLDDLPEGYSVDTEGATRSADKLPADVAGGYLGGYYFSAMSYDGNETVAHTVLVYSDTVRPKDLDAFFRATYPVIANWTLTPIPDPKIGQSSIGYCFMPPGNFVPGETLSSGYLIIFEKGKFFEIVKVTGPRMNQSYAIDLAREASLKKG